MLVTANIFQPLMDVFEAVLKAIHSVGFSWGWSIVLLTVVIRALLLPLAIKQFHSMQRMQAHMPELKAIQAKYKDDKQRQQQETMKFYQENNVNPFASCLPLAAQLPVFISLFYMLRTSLRHDICPDLNPLHAKHTVPCGHHASFLFIHDLTTNATGVSLIVLLVLYVGTQLASSLMAATPQMDRNQRLMMLVLPLFFVFIVVNFPAGVLVYWITTNTWTMLQQYVIRKRIGTPPPPVGGDSGGAVATAGAIPAKATAPEPNGRKAGLLSRVMAGAAGTAEPPPAKPPRPRGAQGSPPPPPRKKKKRSGRRR